MGSPGPKETWRFTSEETGLEMEGNFHGPNGEAGAKAKYLDALTPQPGALSSSSVGTLWEGTVRGTV